MARLRVTVRLRVPPDKRRLQRAAPLRRARPPAVPRAERATRL